MLALILTFSPQEKEQRLEVLGIDERSRRESCCGEFGCLGKRKRAGRFLSRRVARD
jgi:hypothetical protein